MKKLLLLLTMLVVVGISSYAAETTWKSQPTTAAEYDAVFDYTSYTSTTAPTTWTDTSNNQNVVWSITPLGEKVSILNEVKMAQNGVPQIKVAAVDR